MSPPAAPKAPSTLASVDAVGREMARSLGRLLDRARGAREVLPHLAALERGLLQHGSAAVDRVPESGLARICSQLASLPVEQDDQPLNDLLARLSKKLKGDVIEWEPPSEIGGFDPNRTVVIREISHSEFMAAAAEEHTPTERLPLRER
jgi:hypothetical protein